MRAVCSSFLILALSTSLFAQSAPPKKDEVAEALKPRLEAVSELRTKSEKLTKKISEVTAKLPTNDESIAALKELVQELSEVNEQLKKLQTDIDAIKAWIDGTKKELPKLQAQTATNSRTRNRTYLQFQFNDGQNNPNNPRPNDGFTMRRSRIGQEGQINDRASYRLAFDFSGSQRMNAELRDLQLNYDVEPGKFRLIGGQTRLPLGNDIPYSSSEREMPERANYNQRLFAGERGRGIYGEYQLGNGFMLQGGLWNALTVSDPQQLELNTFRNPSGTRMAGTLGLRYSDKNTAVGLTSFTGYRNDLTYRPDASSAAIQTESGQRQFLYLDAMWRINPTLTFRGETMWGRDRVPTFSGSGANRRTSASFDEVRGNQLSLSWNLNPRNTLTGRIEYFDPNVAANDNFLGYGLAWSYLVGPGVKLTFAHEIFREQGFDQPNNLTTIRVQFKF